MRVDPGQREKEARPYIKIFCACEIAYAHNLLQNVPQLLGQQGRGQGFLIFAILANEERYFGNVSSLFAGFCSAEHLSPSLKAEEVHGQCESRVKITVKLKGGASRKRALLYVLGSPRLVMSRIYRSTEE